MQISHLSLTQQLRELQRFHDEQRLEKLGEGGKVTSEASYHAALSDAAARAAAHFEAASITG